MRSRAPPGPLGEPSPAVPATSFYAQSRAKHTILNWRQCIASLGQVFRTQAGWRRGGRAVTIVRSRGSPETGDGHGKVWNCETAGTKRSSRQNACNDDDCVCLRILSAGFPTDHATCSDANKWNRQCSGPDHFSIGKAATGSRAAAARGATAARDQSETSCTRKAVESTRIWCDAWPPSEHASHGKGLARPHQLVHALPTGSPRTKHGPIEQTTTKTAAATTNYEQDSRTMPFF